MINCILYCPRTWYLIILKCFMNIDYVSPGSCEWVRDVCSVIFSLSSVNFARDRSWLLPCLTLSHCYIWKEGHTTIGCHLSQATTGIWMFAPVSAVNSDFFPFQLGTPLPSTPMTDSIKWVCFFFCILLVLVISLFGGGAQENCFPLTGQEILEKTFFVNIAIITPVIMTASSTSPSKLY